MKNPYLYSLPLFASLLMLLSIILVPFSPHLQAQDLTPLFDVCPLNDVPYQAPTLPNGTAYDWDFCTGDLTRTPTAILITDFINDNNPLTSSDAWSPEGLDLALDNGNWYGFIMNLRGKNLLRVDFGNSLSNPPVYTNLGVIGSSNFYDNPRKIRIGKDLNGNWFGFINNAQIDATQVGSLGGSIVKLRFGNSLLNIPTASLLVSGAGWRSPNGITLAQENGELKLIVTNYPLNPTNPSLPITEMRFNVFNFGASYDNAPVLNQTFFPVLTTFAIQAIRQNNISYIITFGLGFGTNGIGIRIINFGSSLNNTTPFIERVYDASLPLFSAWDVRLQSDGKNLIAFTVGENGNIFRFNFGNNILMTPTSQNLGNFGLIGTQQLANRPSLAFAMAKDNSKWHLFAINRHPNSLPPFDDNELVRIDFPDICNVLPSGTSTEESPVVQYLSQSAGKNYTNVSILDAGGNIIQTYVDSVNVIPAVTGSFLVENQIDCNDLLQAEIGNLGSCAGEPVRFFNASNGLDVNVNTWVWDFGDGVTSTELNPIHTYTSEGEYQIALTINNPNSACNNTITRTVRLSPPPIADFRIRSIDCATGKVVFEDLSRVPSADAALGGFLTRRTWSFGDGSIFQAGRDDLDRNDIIIKGTQNAGEGGQAQLLSAYAVNATYNVTLVVGNDVCCTSTKIRTISLRPEDLVANFSAASACVGAPTQFTDLSILAASINSQIETWEWTFTAPSGNITSNFNQNPLVALNEAGTYTVKLKVNSQFTCAQEITMPINVIASSVSNFTASTNIGTAPLVVTFTNTSSPDAISYQWDFGDGTTSQVNSPTYTFETPGTYIVQLQSKNANNCGTLVSREIRVLDNPTSLADDGSLGIKVYPNPSTGIFFIESQQNNLNAVSIQVRDAQGNEVYRQELDRLSGKVQITLPEFLSSGLYFLQIQSGDRIAQKKIIKR
jgi:PKD repeat protein